MQWQEYYPFGLTFEVAPIRITFNNNEITTTGTKVEVIRALPDDALEGVWITKKIIEGKLALLIEQRFVNVFSMKKTEPNIMTSGTTSERIFVSSDTENFRQSGAKLERSHVEDSSVYIEGKSVRCKTTVEIFVIDEQFDLDWIDFSYFDNIPDESIFLNDVRIK